MILCLYHFPIMFERMALDPTRPSAGSSASRQWSVQQLAGKDFGCRLACSSGPGKTVGADCADFGCRLACSSGTGKTLGADCADFRCRLCRLWVQQRAGKDFACRLCRLWVQTVQTLGADCADFACRLCRLWVQTIDELEIPKVSGK